MAVLNFDQATKFKSSGILTEYYHGDEQVPQYSFINRDSDISSGKNYKLFPQYLSPEDLMYIYRRIDIASNAVDIPARDVWSKTVAVKVVNEQGNEVPNSPLVKAIWQLNKDNNILGKFEEGHRNARILGMGLVIATLADNKKLSEPVDTVPGGPDGLLYLTAFSRMDVSEILFDRDKESPTYGTIIGYRISVKEKGSAQVDFEVHADRVSHVMEKTVGNSPWGISALESSYDLFTVLKNTDWSAGEAYYQNASPMYVLSWDDSEGAEPPDDEELDAAEADLKKMNVTQRYIVPKSWKLTTIQGSGVLPDPGKMWTPIVERIAGGVQVPMQLLLGTSAGALASGETNLSQYYGHISAKQDTFAEPLLMEFYGKLQKWGILPEGEFDLEWPPLAEMSQKDKSEIAVNNVAAAVASMGNPLSGIPPLMTVGEAREQLLGMNPELGSGRNPQVKTDQQSGHHHDAAPVGEILNGYSEASRLFLKPLNSQVKGRTMSLQQAKGMVEEYVDELGVAISEQVLGSLIRMAPPDVQDDIRLNGLSPQGKLIVERQVRSIKKLAFKQLDDAYANRLPNS